MAVANQIIYKKQTFYCQFEGIDFSHSYVILAYCNDLVQKKTLCSMDFSLKIMKRKNFLSCLRLEYKKVERIIARIYLD